MGIRKVGNLGTHADAAVVGPHEDACITAPSQLKRFTICFGAVSVAALSLAGCSSTSGVIPITEDLYSIIENYAPIQGGAETARKSATNAATEYCSARGKEFKFEAGVDLCRENRELAPCRSNVRSKGYYSKDSPDLDDIMYRNEDEYRTKPKLFGVDIDGPTGYKLAFRCINGGSNSAITSARQSPPRIDTNNQKYTDTVPIIYVVPSIRTSESTVDVSGKIVSEGKIVSLTADGNALSFSGDGDFSFSRAAPIGKSEIRLIATNELGMSGRATIRIARTTPDASIAAFPPLDPTHLKGAANPKAVALIIGIEHYKSAPPAEYAENDARIFYDYAVNALGVSADRIKLLTGSEAHRLDVEKALLTWVKPLIAKDQTDVFVFFSGHGLASDDGKDLFLLPYDGDRDLLAESSLRRKKVIDVVTEAGAKSATLFLDTCYSGGTRSKVNLLASARPILIAAKEESLPANVTILAAAANDQLSSSLASTKHGLFSYFLMKGLEGEAAGDGHAITANTLAAYLANRIPPEAAKLGRSQTPQLLGDGGKVLSSW